MFSAMSTEDQLLRGQWGEDWVECGTLSWSYRRCFSGVVAETGGCVWWAEDRWESRTWRWRECGQFFQKSGDTRQLLEGNMESSKGHLPPGVWPALCHRTDAGKGLRGRTRCSAAHGWGAVVCLESGLFCRSPRSFMPRGGRLCHLQCLAPLGTTIVKSVFNTECIIILLFPFPSI